MLQVGKAKICLILIEKVESPAYAGITDKTLMQIISVNRQRNLCAE